MRRSAISRLLRRCIAIPIFRPILTLGPRFERERNAVSLEAPVAEEIADGEQTAVDRHREFVPCGAGIGIHDDGSVRRHRPVGLRDAVYLNGTAGASLVRDRVDTVNLEFGRDFIGGIGDVNNHRTGLAIDGLDFAEQEDLLARVGVVLGP